MRINLAVVSGLILMLIAGGFHDWHWLVIGAVIYFGGIVDQTWGQR